MADIRIDGHKLIFHPERVAEWLDRGDCFPIYVEVGTTNRCNHRCSFCALDYLGYNGVDINSQTLIKNLEDMAKSDVKSMMFAGEGESSLHKDISKFVQTAKSNGVDVSITTNGACLTPDKADQIISHLSWLRFSLDASTPFTYSRVHGVKEGEFKKVRNNIKYIIDKKKENKYPVTVGIQFLMTSQNINEILDATELAKSLGADNIQIKPYSHHPSSNNNLAIDFKKLEGLKEKLTSLSDKNFKVFYRENTISNIQEGINYSICQGLPFFALIDARGNVIPCNLFYNKSEFTYGNINEKTFSEIWTGEQRKEVIKKLNQKGCNECRVGCRLDHINRYLDRLKNPEPHDNFI